MAGRNAVVIKAQVRVTNPATRYLDQSLTTTPSLALNLAKQEIIRMGNIVRTMLSEIQHPFLDKDKVFITNVFLEKVIST